MPLNKNSVRLLLELGRIVPFVAFVISCFYSNNSHAAIKLPALVRDSMILQRDAELKIWGWAAKEEKVEVVFNKKRYNTTASTDGKWSISLPRMQAGGPFDMTIKGSNTIALHDILIGDVWLCSGQSNMVLPMERVKEKYPDDIETANFPEIRQFFIPQQTSLTGALDTILPGNWKSATPKNVLQFSAVAYFFAREIYQKYHVPIGIINASVGGSPIESWMSEEALKTFPVSYNLLLRNRDTASINLRNKQAAAQTSALRQKQDQRDEGLQGKPAWYDTSFIPKGWQNINVPGYWEDLGLKDLDGIVWLRKVVEIPASMTDKPAKLYMGRIVDADFLYVNGVQSGNITYQYPPRRYELPAGLLKPGKNTITIRVINYSGKGGFVPDKPYYLKLGDDTLDLKGQWQFKIAEVFGQGDTTPSAIPVQYQPAALYNAMIHPLKNYSIKGILWYQGESNAAAPENYAGMMSALINNWRSLWQKPDLPFLYVQLANFMDQTFAPTESDWARLRDAQLKTLKVPNTAMAVAIDLGEWNDIHPLNKKDAGHRLALAAQKVGYGEKDLVYSGPVCDSATRDGNKAVLHFSNTGSGLVSSDGEPLQQFAVAGADKKFVWAKAEIKDNTVVVWNEAISNPVYVRYAWADNPFGANLYNKEGLPASPFEVGVR
ncbi:sialate O-acetylesterase [Danxiaibacter flavus]|uniref:Sialate O-acetylesterase n=1 Tax=Danxiaibacter flavus TaxID=3049108 RepID=A0ABV3ZJD0_9BACT|nr:sialate O-acetylesterase [Chitinophagaceae bacterium DXS]